MRFTNIHYILPYSGTTLRLSGDKLASCTVEKNMKLHGSQIVIVILSMHIKSGYEWLVAQI